LSQDKDPEFQQDFRWFVDVFEAWGASNTGQDVAELKAEVSDVKSDIKSLQEDISTMLSIIQRNIVYRNLPVDNYNNK
jgi:hypothetical protein